MHACQEEEEQEEKKHEVKAAAARSRLADVIVANILARLGVSSHRALGKEGGGEIAGERQAGAVLARAVDVGHEHVNAPSVTVPCRVERILEATRCREQPREAEERATAECRAGHARVLGLRLDVKDGVCSPSPSSVVDVVGPMIIIATTATLCLGVLAQRLCRCFSAPMSHQARHQPGQVGCPTQVSVRVWGKRDCTLRAVLGNARECCFLPVATT